MVSTIIDPTFPADGVIPASQLNKQTDVIYNIAHALAVNAGRQWRFIAEEDKQLTFTDSGTYDFYYVTASRVVEEIERSGAKLVIQQDI